MIACRKENDAMRFTTLIKSVEKLERRAAPPAFRHPAAWRAARHFGMENANGFDRVRD